MTPSHSRKKGVRYRYYISQAILQSRKAQVGQVFRVPAPDIEAVVERFVRERCKAPQEDIRSLLEARVGRITVRTDSISVALRGGEDDPASPEAQSRQIVSLPWSKKPFRAEKGITRAPLTAQETCLLGAETVITAIARARRWVEQLTAGGSLAEIAKQQGKGERQIRHLVPLAFVPPAIVRRILDGSLPVPSVTVLARTVPLVWQ